MNRCMTSHVTLLGVCRWSMIPVMYPFSRLFSIPSTAMVVLQSVNIFLGTTATLATYVIEFLQEDDEVQPPLSISLLLPLPQLIPVMLFTSNFKLFYTKFRGYIGITLFWSVHLSLDNFVPLQKSLLLHGIVYRFVRMLNTT